MYHTVLSQAGEGLNASEFSGASTRSHMHTCTCESRDIRNSPVYDAPYIAWKELRRDIKYEDIDPQYPPMRRVDKQAHLDGQQATAQAEEHSHVIGTPTHECKKRRARGFRGDYW